MRITIIKAGRVDEYGRPLNVGSTVTVPDALGASLVSELFATDTDGVLTAPANRPFDQAPFAFLNITPAQTAALWFSPTSTAGPCGVLPLPGSASLAGDATNGKVINSQIPAAAAFYGCRLVYLNFDTAAVMAIDGAKVAPSTATGGAGASANNSALTFSSFVTFSGSQSVNVPQATTGAGGQIIPGVAVSDFVPVTSLPRTDVVSAPPLLRIATHFAPSASPTTHPSYNGTNYTNFNLLPGNPGFNYGNNQYTGTLATLTSTAQPTFDIYGGQQNPISAIFYYSTRVASLVAFGDSLVQGGTTSTLMDGWPAYATWRSYGTTSPMEVSSLATSGQQSVDTFAILKAYVAQYKPQYVSFKAWSPNDGDTQAIYDTTWGRTLDAIEYCRLNGVTPVVLTSGPAAGMTWSRIKAQNARVMALPAYVKKVDVGALINDPSNDGTIRAAYSAGDGTHYTVAAYQAIADAVISAVATTLP